MMTDTFDTEEVFDLESEDATESSGDELFTQARELYEENAGDITVSLLQRKLRIGYARAARLMDILNGGGTAADFNDGDRVPKKHKVDPIGLSLYGESFTGFQKIEEYKHLIPAFKEHYYECRIKNPKCTITSITRSFNEAIAHEEVGFFPYSNTLRQWRRKWDKDILEKKGMQMAVVTTKKNVQQVLKTRVAQDGAVIEYETPSYDSLEQTLQTFGGELLNDALTQMKNDQELEDMYDTDELMRRKNHVLNVFSHVTKMVHGKAALMLKASQEKRENANFLMDLMKKSTAGTMTVEEIQALKSTYTDITKPENVSQSVA